MYNQKYTNVLYLFVNVVDTFTYKCLYVCNRDILQFSIYVYTNIYYPGIFVNVLKNNKK